MEEYSMDDLLTAIRELDSNTEVIALNQSGRVNLSEMYDVLSPELQAQVNRLTEIADEVLIDQRGFVHTANSSTLRKHGYKTNVENEDTVTLTTAVTSIFFECCYA